MPQDQSQSALPLWLHRSRGSSPYMVATIPSTSPLRHQCLCLLPSGGRCTAFAQKLLKARPRLTCAISWHGSVFHLLCQPHLQLIKYDNVRITRWHSFDYIRTVCCKWTFSWRIRIRLSGRERQLNPLLRNLFAGSGRMFLPRRFY